MGLPGVGSTRICLLSFLALGAGRCQLGIILRYVLHRTFGILVKVLLSLRPSTCLLRRVKHLVWLLLRNLRRILLTHLLMIVVALGGVLVRGRLS